MFFPGPRDNDYIQMCRRFFCQYLTGHYRQNNFIWICFISVIKSYYFLPHVPKGIIVTLLRKLIDTVTPPTSLATIVCPYTDARVVVCIELHFFLVL